LKNRKEPRVKLQEDGWQIPVGLTVKDAIEIHDSDVEEEVPVPVSVQCIDTICTAKTVGSSVIGVDENVNEDITVSGPSQQSASAEKTTDNDLLASECKHTGTAGTSNNTCTTMIDLCTPDSKSKAKGDSSFIDAKQEEETTSKSNDETSAISNPFLKFAHDLGNSESSYFTELISSNSPSAATEHEKPSSQNARKSIRNSLDKSCHASTKNKKRKRTFSKVDNECEFSGKTAEELGECRNKWQSFADQDAPIEIRRFQVLIAARVHCQAHDQIARRVMNGLRDHFRKPELGMGLSAALPKVADDEDRKIKHENKSAHAYCEEQQYAYLSPETLRKADPGEISKLLSSVLFANVKAKHIIQAAQEIKFQFGGRVPESKASLKSIIGIGPKLAELLYYVNSYDAYRL